MIQKLRSKKGFTLMEMLIVVAIIAILIAIAIPTFASQLEKANQATDAANIRAAYAEAVVKALDAAGGEATVVTESPMKSKDFSKLDQNSTIGGTKLSDISKTKGNYETVKVVLNDSGEQTVTFGTSTTPTVAG